MRPVILSLLLCLATCTKSQQTMTNKYWWLGLKKSPFGGRNYNSDEVNRWHHPKNIRQALEMGIWANLYFPSNCKRQECFVWGIVWPWPRTHLSDAPHKVTKGCIVKLRQRLFPANAPISWELVCCYNIYPCCTAKYFRYWIRKSFKLQLLGLSIYFQPKSYYIN